MTFTPRSHPHREPASQAGIEADSRMPNPQVPTRARAFERRVLDRHGSPEFIAEVQTRLERGERVLGDSWAARSPLELIAEAREEACDLAAWALLALQRLGEGPCDEAAASQLVGAINTAAAAHSHLEAARELAEVPLESA